MALIITELLAEELNWVPLEGSERYFSTSAYPVDRCQLRMNDFPDEPLWTLIADGDEHHFDDQPLCWKINYRSV